MEREFRCVKNIQISNEALEQLKGRRFYIDDALLATKIFSCEEGFLQIK